MTFDEFNKYQEALFAECMVLRDTKGKEYAHSVDRFANFKRQANKNKKLTPLDVAQVFLGKHLEAIDSYIENGKTFSTETIRGRFVDAIMYLTLIGGMIEEEGSKPKQLILPEPKFVIPQLVFYGMVPHTIINRMWDEYALTYYYTIRGVGKEFNVAEHLLHATN